MHARDLHDAWTTEETRGTIGSCYSDRPNRLDFSIILTNFRIRFRQGGNNACKATAPTSMLGLLPDTSGKVCDEDSLCAVIISRSMGNRFPCLVLLHQRLLEPHLLCRPLLPSKSPLYTFSTPLLVDAELFTSYCISPEGMRRTLQLMALNPSYPRQGDLFKVLLRDLVDPAYPMVRLAEQVD